MQYDQSKSGLLQVGDKSRFKRRIILGIPWRAGKTSPQSYNTTGTHFNDISVRSRLSILTSDQNWIQLSIHPSSQSTDNDNVMRWHSKYLESWVTMIAPMSFRQQKSVGSNSCSTFLFQITYQITMHLLLLSSLLMSLGAALPQTCETKNIWEIAIINVID